MPPALSDQKQPSSVLAIQATVLVFNLVSSIAIITVNKYTFSYFPYPAALTCVHYAFSWLGTELLLCCGAFEARPIDRRHGRPFVGLVIAWRLCNPNPDSDPNPNLILTLAR